MTRGAITERFKSRDQANSWTALDRSELVGHDHRTAGGEHAADPVADRNLRTLDLRRGDAAHLPHALLQRIHAVHAGVHVAEPAAIGVQRQLAARAGIALGHTTL